MNSRTLLPRLLPLLLAGAFAPAFAEPLPSCAGKNFNLTRNLFTSDRYNTAVGVEHPVRTQLVNQQCLLTVVSREQGMRLRTSGGGMGPGPNGAEAIVEGRYMAYVSNGGDGGGGGSQRIDGGGGGGGGAGAVQQRQEIVLTPGTYLLTLGAGGPGGQACMGGFGGGPGWGGSPSSIKRLSDGVTIAGVQGADTWQRPSRAENEKMAGKQDGHGGGGYGKSPGGAGGSISAMETTPPQAGGIGPSAPRGVGGVPGDKADTTSGTARVAAGGGGGAGLGDGGDGAGETTRRFDPPQVGGLGAGGGGGIGSRVECTAGAPGGNGYIALRAQ